MEVCAYDYSEGFVENMKTKAASLNVSNLEARQGDSHAQLSLYPARNSVLHSHWSSSNEAWLSLVQSFRVLLRQLSCASKNQLWLPKI